MIGGRPPAMARVVAWSVLGAGALLAGLTAQGVGLPAAWLVGPMLVAVAFALLRRGDRLGMPRSAQRAAQAVLGGVLAAAFSPAVLPLVADRWPTVALAVGGTLLLSSAGGVLLARRARLDTKTASLGTLPGGASGMLAMSDSLGADTRLVALMQYVRVVSVVLTATAVAHFASPAGTTAGAGSLAGSGPAHGSAALVPGGWPAYALTALLAVVGAWGGTRLRLPTGALLGPFFLGVLLEGAGVLDVGWPQGVPEASYCVLGIYVGLLFDKTSVGRAGRLLPLVLATTAMLIAACAGLAVAFAALTGVDFLTAYLATTPGGIDAVAIVALGSGADASLVVAVQMLRLLAVVALGQVIGWWQDR